MLLEDGWEGVERIGVLLTLVHGIDFVWRC
jgi:hypothetical protein